MTENQEIESSDKAIIEMVNANAEPLPREIQCGHWTPSQWVAFNRLCAKYQPKRPPLPPPEPLNAQLDMSIWPKQPDNSPRGKQ